MPMFISLISVPIDKANASTSNMGKNNVHATPLEEKNF